jgi:Putative amidase domain
MKKKIAVSLILLMLLSLNITNRANASTSLLNNNEINQLEITRRGIKNITEDFLEKYDDVALKGEDMDLSSYICDEGFKEFLSKKLYIVDKRYDEFNLHVDNYKHKYKYSNIDIDRNVAYVDVSVEKEYKYEFLDELTYEVIDYSIKLEKVNNQWLIKEGISNDIWDFAINNENNRNEAVDLDEFIKREEEAIEQDKAELKEDSNQSMATYTTEMNMLTGHDFNRTAMREYARRHYNDPNKAFYDFTNLGGDCTNFTSQIIHAGGAPMDSEGKYKWYYYSLNSRSPSWTGTMFLYDYLINNDGLGPHGVDSDFYNVITGDVIQIDFNNDNIYTHSPSVVQPYIRGSGNLYTLTVAARTYNFYNRPILTYPGVKRYIHLTQYFK